jgi:hypothetical protein
MMNGDVAKANINARLESDEESATMISSVKNMPLQSALTGRGKLVANPVKDVGGGIGLDGCTRRHENKSKHTEQKRQCQTFESTEYIKDFGEGWFHHAGCDIGDYSDDRDERV